MHAALEACWCAGLTGRCAGLLAWRPCRKALDALDCHTQNGWNKLLKGIQDAKILQQAIIM